MTHEELDALPEDGTFGCRIEMRDGKEVRIPVLHTVGPLYTPPDEPIMYWDSEGRAWMVGYGPENVRYKRRLHTLDA